MIDHLGPKEYAEYRALNSSQKLVYDEKYSERYERRISDKKTIDDKASFCIAFSFGLLATIIPAYKMLIVAYSSYFVGGGEKTDFSTAFDIGSFGVLIEFGLLCMGIYLMLNARIKYASIAMKICAGIFAVTAILSGLFNSNQTGSYNERTRAYISSGGITASDKEEMSYMRSIKSTEDKIRKIQDELIPEAKARNCRTIKKCGTPKESVESFNEEIEKLEANIRWDQNKINEINNNKDDTDAAFSFLVVFSNVLGISKNWVLFIVNNVKGVCLMTASIVGVYFTMRTICGPVASRKSQKEALAFAREEFDGNAAHNQHNPARNQPASHAPSDVQKNGKKPGKLLIDHVQLGEDVAAQLIRDGKNKGDEWRKGVVSLIRHTSQKLFGKRPTESKEKQTLEVIENQLNNKEETTNA